jgi:acyl-CoA thioester hydrolase
MRKKKIENRKTLSVETEIKIRFSEVDSMGIVWHGSYVKYFEDGREAFGKKYNIGYMDAYNNGFQIPLVKLNFDYIKSLKYNDIAILRTTYIDTPAAKINFEYELRRKSNNELITTGESIQIFMNMYGELHLTTPEFVKEWKEKYLI